MRPREAEDDPDGDGVAPARAFSVDDLQMLALVAEVGSMNAASRRSGLSKSVLSRAVAKLEGIAGGPLFDRTQTGMALTETGRVLLPVAQRAVEVVRDAGEALRSASGTPQGQLRVAASALSGSQLVAPALAEMARRHPRVETTLRVTARGPDPVAENLDLVLRIGRPEEGHLAARRLLSSPLALYTVRAAAAAVDLEDPAAVEALGRVVIAIDRVPADLGADARGRPFHRHAKRTAGADRRPHRGHRHPERRFGCGVDPRRLRRAARARRRPRARAAGLVGRDDGRSTPPCPRAAPRCRRSRPSSTS